MGLVDADEAFRLERARARKLADLCLSGNEIDAEELRRVTEDGEPLRPEKPEPALGAAEGQSAAVLLLRLRLAPSRDTPPLRRLNAPPPGLSQAALRERLREGS